MPRADAAAAPRTRSPWACCTDRRSCCRSPRRATSRSCRGCAAGPTPSWTPSCARRSRSRCTPAPRRRCSSACATRSATPRAASTRRRVVARRAVLRAAGHRRLRARAPDRAAPGHAGDDRRRAAARRAGAGRGRPRGRGRAAARTPAPSTRSRSASRRPARWCPACRATARRSPPRALRGFGREDANALSRHVALPVIVGATVLKGARLARRGLPAGIGGRSPPALGASFALDAGLDRGSSARSSATARSCPTRPTAGLRRCRRGSSRRAQTCTPSLRQSSIAVRSSDAYAAAGVDTDQADAGVGALVGGPAHDRARPPDRLGVPAGTTRASCASRPNLGDRALRPTASAPSSSSPSRPTAWRPSASTASR